MSLENIKIPKWLIKKSRYSSLFNMHELTYCLLVFLVKVLND